jgi:hypothetical protein
LKDRPKFTLIGIFLFENMPSGKPMYLQQLQRQFSDSTWQQGPAINMSYILGVNA